MQRVILLKLQNKQFMFLFRNMLTAPGNIYCVSFSLFKAKI